MRRHDDGHHHGMDVGVGDDVRVLLLLADGVAHPARPVGRGAHLLDDAARQLPEVAHRVRHGDLLLGGRPAPDVHRVRHRILAQQRHVVFLHSQEVQADGERCFPEHLLDQVGAAVVDEAVDVLARHAPHHGLQRHQRLGREGLDQRPPARHVHRLHLVDHGALHAVVVVGQDVQHPRLHRRHALQRHRGVEALVVTEHRLDVVVARDHPVADPRRPEHRLLRARPAQVLGRVLLVAVAEGVEGGGAGADRAAVGVAPCGMVHRATGGGRACLAHGGGFASSLGMQSYHVARPRWDRRCGKPARWL